MDQTVINGGTASFSVIVASVLTYSCQWYKVVNPNNKKLNGQTSSTLTLPNVSYSDEGQYFVEVKNAAGTVTSSNATLTIDTAPVANNDTYTTLEDVPLIVPAAGGILNNDVDVDGDVLTALLVSNVAHGNLIQNTNGGLTYTPNTNYNGSDSFTYRAHDGFTNGNVATVTINIMSINDPPLAVNDSANTLEDVSVTIKVLANDSDPEGTPLALTGTSTTNGTAVISGTNVVFTPSTNFNGVVVFSYTVSDGTNAATANVTVTVTPINDPPLAVNDGTNTLEDVSVTINVLANDSDPEGSPLTLTGASTTNGTAVITGTNVVFRPSTNFSGVVVFTYTVSDGANSATANVTVTVAPVNDAPVAYNDTYTTLEDVPLIVPPAGGILTNDVDVDRDALTAVLVTNVTHGILILSTNGSFTYTPNTNYNGSDSFAYRAHDGLTTGNVATVTINITPVNDPPIAGNDSDSVLEDGNVTISVLDNDSDPEGAPLTVTGASTTNGTVAIVGNGTKVKFTPLVNFNGTVVFTYTVSDSTNSATAHVTVTVTPLNDSPLANDDSTNTLEDVSVTIKVLANDSDPESTLLTLTSTATTNGTAVISDTNVVFRAATNFNGIVVFSYTVSDGTNSATANVTVTVAPVNDAPVANNDTYTTLEDVLLIVPRAAGILTNDVDVDGDALTAELVTNVIHGTLNLSTNGSFTYTPTNNYSGSDSFTYRPRDGATTGNVATVTIIIPGLKLTLSGFQLQLSGPPASTYIIQASTNLRDWTPISTNSGLTGSVVFTDTNAANFSQRFYRALAR